MCAAGNKTWGVGLPKPFEFHHNSRILNIKLQDLVFSVLDFGSALFHHNLLGPFPGHSQVLCPSVPGFEAILPFAKHKQCWGVPPSLTLETVGALLGFPMGASCIPGQL